MHSTFIHLSGGKRGRSETFDRTLIRIGTAPGCALRFSGVRDPGVSPHHAQIRFEPRLVQLRAFFPDLPEPISVSVQKVSETADVALLKAETRGRSIPILRLDRTGKEAVPGRPVLLMGYPAGVDLLLARVEPTRLQELVKDDAVDVVALLESLGRQRLIRPYTTWGHLADVRPHQIAYDAETVMGGSGGPILSLSGRVIGVNYAAVPGFGSANFGIPIRFGLALLQ